MAGVSGTTLGLLIGGAVALYLVMNKSSGSTPPPPPGYSPYPPGGVGPSTAAINAQASTTNTAINAASSDINNLINSIFD
jgi:hypothetical protein